MSDNYKRALRACTDGLLKLSRDDEGRELFCYTQDCFFGKDTWDETTKSHRGKLYYNAQEVNKPFSKIFNVDEVDDTRLDVILERMKNEPHEILDKANGHLFMLSCFEDDTGKHHAVFHTKGSLPNPQNDLLNDDIKIFLARYGEKFDQVINHFPNSTWMFEALVRHDKHTMYDQQVGFYGDEDTFILLSANILVTDDNVVDPGWHEMTHDHLRGVSQVVGCPVIHKYKEVDVKGTPNDWLDHKNREGYVIHFLNDHSRCKVKTKEYWKLRFKNDLTGENIISSYASNGMSKLKKKLPEEVVNDIIEVLESHLSIWYNEVYVKTLNIMESVLEANEFGFTNEQRKNIFQSDDYSMPQKQHLMLVADRKPWLKNIHGSKDLRRRWKDYMLDHPKSVEEFDHDLIHIVDKL